MPWCTRPSRSARSAAAGPRPRRAVSGRATVVGYTVNQHQWHPDLPPPYVIAVVALAEDPSVRLTTNIVGCDDGDVAVGLEVQVRFEQCDDVWLPLFEPTGSSAPTRSPTSPPAARARGRPSTTAASSTGAVLSGVGRSALGRRLLVDPLSLTVDATPWQ